MSKTTSKECSSCDTVYKITIMSEDAEVMYCPFCGCDDVSELDLSGEFSMFDDLEDEPWED